MAILTYAQILSEVRNGRIVIDPFDESKVYTNSVNVSMHPELKVYTPDLSKTDMSRYMKMPKIYQSGVRYYDSVILDMKKPNKTKTIMIPEDGFMLQPGILYLGRTRERVYTPHYVPILTGRSSVGRLGISVHVTAGLGDIGFDGTWTLEITAEYPTVIYPDVEIGQIYFETVEGSTDVQYNGRYNHQTDAGPSLMHKPKADNEREFRRGAI